MTDAQVPTHEEKDLGFDATLKKKKKKAVNFDDLEAEPAPDAQSNDDDMFSGIKKKSKSKSAGSEQAEEAAPPAPEEGGEFSDLKKKKKSTYVLG